MSFSLTSSAFDDGSRIPMKYTGEGEDLSPPLSWDEQPQGTQELVLIVDDPDAPDKTWVHWVAYGISPERSSLAEGVSSVKQEEDAPFPEGKNSWPNQGYQGPMPPPGHGTHRYYFKLYALDKRLNLDPGLTKEQLLKEIAGHIIGQAELMGTYSRD
ncbi:MAG: YbhB/YbcL family Raf kinase inhibitor-like protein [Phycisphaerae bacterium]